MVLVRGAVCCALVAVAALAHAAPFPSTDQNPLLGGFSITAPARLAPARETSAQLSLNWSSTAARQQVGSEFLVVDAESQEWRFQLDHSLSEKFAIRVQLPFRKTSAGSLDSAIERWHDFFGLPNGDRSSLTRDLLRIEYRRAGATLLSYHDTTLSHMGDATVDFGWQARASASSATSVWSSVTLPTGDPDELSGASNWAFTTLVSHTQTVGRFELFGHAGVRVGDASGLLDEQSESLLWMAMIGGEFRATAHLGLMLQLDAHSAPFKSSELELLGPAYILTFGGEYQFASLWRVQLGAAEDVKVESCPDVSFSLRVSKAWK